MEDFIFAVAVAVVAGAILTGLGFAIRWLRIEDNRNRIRRTSVTMIGSRSPSLTQMTIWSLFTPPRRNAGSAKLANECEMSATTALRVLETSEDGLGIWQSL
jgi:hypothetical protein